MLRNDSGNTAQKNGNRGKGPATGPKPGTYILLQSFSHEQSIPVANLLSTIALCTGRRCATIQRLLRTYASRLVLSDVVVVGSAGNQHVA